MCGISGIFGLRDPDLVRRMTQSMVHRGPDDEGYYVDEAVSLGSRRLSIVDVAGGRQPMANEDGTVWAVFNGEIYNYRQLKARLIEQGHRFATSADTEVIPHLYEEYGDAFVHLLRGMFGIAVWDARRRRLVVARDRLGIKPLYFAERAGRVYFASEIKAILEAPEVERAVDVAALDLYVTFQYVPGPRTLFKGIHKLLPGHLLVVDDSGAHTRRYWDFVLDDHAPPMMEGDAAAELHRVLKEVIGLHLLADVPVGALLSGGVDSSLVVALMQAHAGARVRTYTIGFAGSGVGHINELDKARLVADHLGTDHTELVVSGDVGERLPRLVWHLDEPIADRAALPTFLICEHARRDVKVLLTGEGGDELFGGYPRYKWFALADRLDRAVPRRLRHGLVSTGLAALPQTRRVRRLATVLAPQSPAERHVEWVANFGAHQKALLYRPAFSGQLAASNARDWVEECLRERSDANRDARALSSIHDLMYMDAKHWLVDDILAKVDKMSMAASVEARVPLLDHRLVELVASLPLGLKLHRFGTKRLLRRVLADYVPPSIVEQGKQPFDVPMAAWLRGPLRPMVEENLSTQRCHRRGYFDPGYVRWLIEAHISGRHDFNQQIWNLLCLELWHRIYLDREGGLV